MNIDNMKRYLIDSGATVREALEQLNTLGSRAMTLIVTDGESRIAGTLTDGDIRRGLIRGAGIDDRVERVMCRHFSSIDSRSDIAALRDLRLRGIMLVPLVDPDRHIIDILDLTRRRSYLPVDAVLMAGGRGERLRPLTLSTPKPLLPVGDRAIIDHNVDALADYGITRISATVNYLKEQIIGHFSHPTLNGAVVNCVAEKQFLGTIGSLSLIPNFSNDSILVMNSDLLTDIDYEDFFIDFQTKGAMMAAAAVPYSVTVPYGIFDCNDHKILGVNEKPTYNYYANAGIYLLRREALRFIPEGEVFNATDLIETLAAHGETVTAYPLSGLWIDIGSPQEYRKACELVKSNGLHQNS